jgi:hypothetical protein
LVAKDSSSFDHRSRDIAILLEKSASALAVSEMSFEKDLFAKFNNDAQTLMQRFTIAYLLPLL